MQFSALDIETAPRVNEPQPYALQPWRQRYPGRAFITSIAAYHPDQGCSIAVDSNYQYEWLLKPLYDTYVATWNGLFDVAWLLEWAESINSDIDIRRIKWVDAMLLDKWVNNSQAMEFGGSWALDSRAEHWLQDWPLLPEFLHLKANPPASGEDDAYWQRRNELDTIATAMIADRAWAKLTPEQRRSAMLDMESITIDSQGWLDGVAVDADKALEMGVPTLREMYDIEVELGLCDFDFIKNKEADTFTTIRMYREKWRKSPILGSPEKMRWLFFKCWGLIPTGILTDSGAESTDKTALTYLADQDDRITAVLRWRELNTRYIKFIEGIRKATEYLGDFRTHPSPKLFSTITGRQTYATKSGKKGEAAKAIIGFALHQMPREKEIRNLLVSGHPDYVLVQFDASGQEARLVAEYSQDPVLLDIFRNGKDIHSNTGANLAHVSYEYFMQQYEADVDAYAGPRGFRYQGKFTNLSSQYRIGTKKLMRKARVDYGMVVDWNTAKRWGDTFKQTYENVPKYWAWAINVAKKKGYAESLGHRRFYLSYWHGDYKWGTESNAINHPIQGSGADMKYLAKAMMKRHFPHFRWRFDLHDGIFYLVKRSPELHDDIRRAKVMLANLPYEQAWGYKPSLPLPWDAEVGSSWGGMEKVV